MDKGINIGEVLRIEARDNRLPCIKIFELIERHSVFPDIAGIALNSEKIKITNCQLGLFGYPEGKRFPACDNVSDKLKEKIEINLEDGKLSCPAAWKIASEINISKIDLGAACEKLGIKINKCQLGAF